MHFGNKPSCIYYATKRIRITRKGSTSSFAIFRRASRVLKSFCRCTIQGKRGDKPTRFDIHNKPSEAVELQRWLTAFRVLPRCPIMGSDSGLNTADLHHINDACAKCPRRLCYEEQNAESIRADKIEHRDF